jgi:hypothetical protein
MRDEIGTIAEVTLHKGCGMARQARREGRQRARPQDLGAHGRRRADYVDCDLRSDLHLYQVLVPFTEECGIVGHEPLGIIEDAGPEVTNLSPGDRVVISF